MLATDVHGFGVLKVSTQTAPEAVSAAELLDVKAVAALLNCSTRHIIRLADGGKMPAPVRLGVLVRWNRAALLDWVSKGCQPVRRVRGAAE